MKILMPFFMLLLASIASASPRQYKPVPPPQPASTDADSSHAWDALHYELLLTVTPLAVPDSLFISGVVSIEFTPVDFGLDTVDLNLVGLEVTDAELEGVNCTWTRVDCLLYVALPGPHNPGERLHLVINYNGVPVQTGQLLGGVGIFHPFTGMIYTQADPRGLRNWMPCWDEPWDKATIRQKLDIPNVYTVAANGTLEYTAVGQEYTLWSYYMDQPIATYLVSFCAADYDTFSQSAGPVSVKHFVYPQHLAAAQIDFQRVPEMIQTFGAFFGAYPFSTFGYAEAPVFGNGGGAMENQTMVTYGNLLITGTGAYEDIAAHELSHMWFGDAAGYLDWPDMWLSEGFASYAEALWHEHLNGFTNYRQVMSQMQQAYMNWESLTNPHPMYDPPWDIIWSQLTYEKGASVLHMLRYEVADSADFFQILQDYFAAYRYGNASTWELSAICQQVTGDDYGWFFNQWVFEAGYPKFEYFAVTEPAGDSTRVNLTVAQVQPETFADFQTHADLYLYSGGVPQIERILIEALPTQTIIGAFPQEIDSVRLDPLNWLLGTKIRRDDLTAPLLEATDPVIADSGGDGFLDPGETGDLTFLLTNMGLPTPGLTVTVTTLDPQLFILDGEQQISGLSFYGMQNFAADPFVLQNAPNSPPRWVELAVQVDETGSGDPVATLSLNVPIGTPQLLLIDDDGGSNAEVKHQEALNAIGRVYRTVTYVSPDSLPPLEDYLGVLWACGPMLTNTLTASDQALLQNYFAQGGALFLSGRGVVPDLSATSFFQNTLHAQSQGTTSIGLLIGADPLLEGTSFFVSGESLSLDKIEPDSSAGSGRLLTYSTTYGAAVKYDGSYKVCLLGFGFENILAGNPNFNQPEELLGPLLEWITGTSGLEPGQSADLPTEFWVGQNFPNPFNAETVIPLELPQRSALRVELFNLRGQSLGVIYDGIENAGGVKLRHDASGLSSGIYFYRILARELGSGRNLEAVKKMLLLK